MKKIFTLAIAALAALSVSAQDVATKQTLAFTGNAWNVNVLATGNVGITCNSQWGEYKLTRPRSGRGRKRFPDYPW